MHALMTLLSSLKYIMCLTMRKVTFPREKRTNEAAIVRNHATFRELRINNDNFKRYVTVVVFALKVPMCIKSNKENYVFSRIILFYHKCPSQVSADIWIGCSHSVFAKSNLCKHTYFNRGTWCSRKWINRNESHVLSCGILSDGCASVWLYHIAYFIRVFV